MDQLALLLILFFAMAIGFVALYLLLRKASAEHAAKSSEQAITAAVRATLAERGATAEAVGRCLLYTSPSPRDGLLSRMPSSA